MELCRSVKPISLSHRSFSLSVIVRLHQPQTYLIQLVFLELPFLQMKQECGENLIMIDKPMVRECNTGVGSPTADASLRYASSVMAGYFSCSLDSNG